MGKKEMKSEDLLEKIKQHQFILIIGTTDGRARIREILCKNIDFAWLLHTRKYPIYFLLHRNHIPKWTTFVYDYEYDTVSKILNYLQRKKKPVVIDSFTDVQKVIRGEFIRTVGKKTGEHKYLVSDLDWSIFKRMLQDVIIKLKKQKKKVILYVDETDKWGNTPVGLQITGKEPDVDKSLIYVADLIINASDDETNVIKER